MVKAKRKHPDLDEILARPWCYYCERDFDDLKILINHQKAKHFKCERCGRRLNTAGGLSVHMTQVHKESLGAIEHALPNRSGLDVEIFGMEGIPEDVTIAHNQRVIGQFAQAEAERRASTGNTGAGGAGGGESKKPKFESPSDLKKRLAEHKAKKAAEQAAGINSGNATPSGAGYGGQSPGALPAGSSGYGQQQMQYGAPPGNGAYASYPQPYGQQPPPFGQQPPNFPMQHAPPHTQPPAFGSPGMPPQYPNNQPFAPPQQFQSPNGPGFPPQFQNGPPPQFPSHSPPPFQQSPFQPPHSQNMPQNGMVPRASNLPAASNLPQRPSFGAPPVNAFQMQQMHQGQMPGVPNNGQGSPLPLQANQTLLDNTAPVAAKEADKADVPQAEKKAKKEKDKNVKLVYSDNEVSPEEKMAQLPRYAFAPEGGQDGVTADAITTAA